MWKLLGDLQETSTVWCSAASAGPLNSQRTRILILANGISHKITWNYIFPFHWNIFKGYIYVPAITLAHDFFLNFWTYTVYLCIICLPDSDLSWEQISISVTLPVQRYFLSANNLTACAEIQGREASDWLTTVEKQLLCIPSINTARLGLYLCASCGQGQQSSRWLQPNTSLLLSTDCSAKTKKKARETARTR